MTLKMRLRQGYLHFETTAVTASWECVWRNRLFATFTEMVQCSSLQIPIEKVYQYSGKKNLVHSQRFQSKFCLWNAEFF